MRDAQDLLARVNLVEVGCYEFSGVRGAAVEGGRKIVGPGPVKDWELEDEEHELGVYWLTDGGRLLVRLLVALKSNAGEMRVGMQAEWDTGELTRADVPAEVEEEFINRVAVMTLVPYVRAGISDLASRTMGMNVTMSLIRPGDLEFNSLRGEEPSEISR
ncbi:hypothetical protein [Cellulosimicrobium funkei]|uniref:hypothetical protein n=1 Tax=Cellulosimicrobium funkei TaxID=264251 RepID=UPI00342B438B